MFARTVLLCGLWLVFANTCSAAGRYFTVEYPAAKGKNELQMGVTYTLWLPEGVEKLRGVIVHQHGCGIGACKGGETAAYDLHWQALAKKHACALLGPSYHQEEKQNCRLWCDPRNGSATTFLAALKHFAKESKHPELNDVPWALWGHSGGGFWASLMATMYPDRVAAVWLRSGTAFAAWEKGEIDKPQLSDAVYAIPTVCNPGVKEKGHKQFNGAWTGAEAMFKAYRVHNALITLAPDPKSAHECGDSRYMAILFFDVCLEARLPVKGAKDHKLRTMDAKKVWLGKPLEDVAMEHTVYPGKANEAVWLPDERVARAWAAYVKTGNVEDKTPPPAPTQVKATKKDDGVEITWDAEADLESGLQAFVIERDGKAIGQVPEKPVGKFGKPLFQSLSYHDTPEKPLAVMRFVDKTANGDKHEYRVIAVNSAGLKSEAAKTVR